MSEEVFRIKKSIFALMSLSILISACQAGPNPMMMPMSRPAPIAPLQAMNAEQPIQAEYSYRKPQASIAFRFKYGNQRTQGIAFFKEFMRKYVDKNDIFNYQTVEKACGSDYCVTFNIFGGNADFIKSTLLVHVRDYVRQRVDVESASIQ